MARVRHAGDAPLPPTRGPDSTALGALLRARRFRLSAGTERIAAHLQRYGGEVAPDAAPWIGSVRPPPDAPTLSLGEHPGTLGPRSFGFLNNVGGIAALDAPLPSLPLKGSLALVVPGRDALPDVAPLAIARGLGISWIVSVGNGDPAEAIAFLAADPATEALAVVLGPGAAGPSLRASLGAKPAVVWGGDPVARAVSRRAGAFVVDGVSQFLARAALLSAGVEPGAEVAVIVVGGGRGFVEGELRAAGLAAKVTAVDERSADELRAAMAEAKTPILLVASALDAAPSVESARVLHADLRHPEHLRALCDALAASRTEEEELRPRPGRPADKELLERVRGEVENELGDHDAKRLLKSYGVKVTRQAPTNTPTGAVKLARTIGLPVEIGDEVAETLPAVKRIAALALEAAKGEHPSVIVREQFPEAPRVEVRIADEPGLGLTVRVGESCALAPLSRADGALLAAATPARRSADQRAVAELLTRVAGCCVAERAELTLTIYCGAEAAVLKASGALRR
jgi:acyl-CoA synthetase (NDP forming)